MAKTKDKKSGVPKKVAGVKVPKAVRQSKSLSTLLTSRLGREILADALIAAAGAVASVVSEAAKSFLPPSLLGDGGSDGERPRYLHKASDHSSRKRSKKSEKKGDDGGKRGKKD